MRLDELQQIPELQLTLLTPAPATDPRIRWVYTSDLPDPGPYLTGGELVLTSLTWYQHPEDAYRFAGALAAADASGLIAGTAVLGALPSALIRACEQHAIALLTIPDEISFGALSEIIIDRLVATRRDELTRTLAHHRRLVAAATEDHNTARVIDIVSQDLGIDCAMLSPSGRLLAGSWPADASATLSARCRRAAATQACPAVMSLTDTTTYSLFTLTSSATDVATAGYLLCSGDHRHWPSDTRDAIREVCDLLALDLGYRQKRRTVERERGHHLLTTLDSGNADPTHLDDQLRRADLQPTDGLFVVVASTDPPDPAWTLPATLLEEATADQPAMVTTIGDVGAVAIVSAVSHMDGRESVHHSASEKVLHQTRRATEWCLPAPDTRLAVGMSNVILHTGALHQAIGEARLAHRIATERPDRTSIAVPADLDSYEALLVSVPTEVRRSFHDRLLGPLHHYDANHQSDLVRTLDTFLDTSGSWRQCAERLHVHVNTLHYRIRRIEQLTGHSLSTLRNRLDFYLALRCAQ